MRARAPLAALAIVAGLVAAPLPVHAEHVSPGEIRWACGGGGSGQRGHPDSCGIDPVGGGSDVQSRGEPEWSADAWIGGREDVIGIEVNGDARAVPVKLLDRHEIVNADVGGEPVAITYCPLCGSGVTFERTLRFEGIDMVLDFAASGFLFQADLVMWDPQTGTLWNQITGTPIGTLEDERVRAEHPDLELKRIPTALATWESWRADHPDTLMLRKVFSSYGGAYAGYSESSQQCGLSSCAGVNESLHPKEHVIGVERPAGAVAFPRFGLIHAEVVQYDIGDERLVVAAKAGGAHAVHLAGDRTFAQSGDTWIDQEGHAWDLMKGAREDGGAELEQVDSMVSFWFAWHDHFPDTELWSPPDTAPGAKETDNGRLPGFTIPVIAGIFVLGALWWRRR